MSLSRYMQKEIAVGNLNAVKRFLWLHKGNAEAVNARSPNYGRFLINIAGDTALTLAIRRGHVEIVWQLVSSNDVDVNKTDGAGFTPLMLAAQFQERQMVNMLLARKDINLEITTPAHGNTALFTAYKYGTKEIVQDLLKCGANPNHKNKKGFTAARAAAADNGMISVNETLDFACR